MARAGGPPGGPPGGPRSRSPRHRASALSRGLPPPAQRRRGALRLSRAGPAEHRARLASRGRPDRPARRLPIEPPGLTCPVDWALVGPRMGAPRVLHTASRLRPPAGDSLRSGYLDARRMLLLLLALLLLGGLSGALVLLLLALLLLRDRRLRCGGLRTLAKRQLHSSDVGAVTACRVRDQWIVDCAREVPLIATDTRVAFVNDGAPRGWLHRRRGTTVVA